MSDKNPEISVLMANYNNCKYIGEAIESILSQNFYSWELVIIDDFSKDNSVEIVCTYLKDNRIRLLKNENNIGYTETLKRLIEAAHSEILVILDSDDALTSEALFEIFSAYQHHPDCGFIYSQFVFCDKNLESNETGQSRLIPSGKSNLNKIYVVAVRSFKKSSYYLTSGYDNEIIYAEDRDIIFKLEEVTKFYFIDKVLYKYRRLPNSQTLDPGKAEISRTSHALAKYKAFVRRQNTNTPNLTKAQMSYELFDAVPSCIKSRNMKRLKFFLVNGFLLFPLNIKAYIILCYRLVKFFPYQFYNKIKNFKQTVCLKR